MRVLIVDTSADTRRAVRRLLTEASLDAQVTEADDVAAALSAAASVDLVLADVETLRAFRARDEKTAVLLTTGHDIPGELVARVKNELERSAMKQELQQANERLREAAITDYLTGVFNRRHFGELLQHELRRSQRYKTPLSIALVDLDHFKKVNDQLGHVAGDLVLSDFAHLLRHSFRATDQIARYGGEEFVVLLPHTRASDAITAVEKVRTQLALMTIGALKKGALTFSAGVASYPSDSCDSADSLIATADQALYRAKQQGRARSVGL